MHQKEGFVTSEQFKIADIAIKKLYLYGHHLTFCSRLQCSVQKVIDWENIDKFTFLIFNYYFYVLRNVSNSFRLDLLFSQNVSLHQTCLNDTS